MPKVKTSAQRVAARPYAESKIARGGNLAPSATEKNNEKLSRPSLLGERDPGQKDEVGLPTSEQLSRGQRKRLAKRENFLRKEKMILSSLKLKRDEDQKQRIDGLDAIKKALLGTTAKIEKAPLSKPTKIANNKAKRKLVANEVEHLNLVLQHPAYRQDPLATLQEHLQNSLSEDRKQQELISKKRTQQEKVEQEETQSTKRKATRRKKYKPRRTR
ncbi:MAG: hypothetical protein SGILL_003809 [Bacillariaceae sp.]